MRRETAAVLIAVALAVAGPAVVGSAVADGDAAGSAAVPERGPEVPAGPFDPDGVLLRARVLPDGSAAWAVEYRVRLANESDRAGFRDVRADIEADPENHTAEFARSIRGMAESAEDATGRTMVVENVSVNVSRTGIPQEYGVVTYRFRWYGFAATGDRLRAGDALVGLFLDEETTLLVSWPERLDAERVRPDPDERRETAVVWEGPKDFARDEPRVVLDAEGATFGTDGVPVPEGGGLPLLVPAGGLLLVVLGAGLLVAWRRRGGTATIPAAAEDESGRSATGDDGPETGTSGPSPEASEDGETEPEPPSESGEDEQAEPEPPEELLSNEERVLRLLEDRGGRAKQRALVEELGWSETKASDVVQEMRDEGAIEVYRLGRENVLALPGQSGFDVGGEEP